MINITNDNISDIAIGNISIEKAVLGNQLVWEKTPEPQPETYELYMWLDGNDEPVDGNLIDKAGGLEWAVNGATHEGTYYEFLNPTSGTATKNLGMHGGGAVVNLGKHWKVVADVEIASNTQDGYIIDFCSYGTVPSGYNGLGLLFSKTYGANSNVKRGGNTGTTQNTSEGVVVSLDEEWNRMTLMWECAPESEGMSVISSYMDNTLCRYTVDFPEMEWTKFRWNKSPYNTLYIGRGALNTSSNKAPLRFRLYDLKMYKRVEE